MHKIAYSGNMAQQRRRILINATKMLEHDRIILINRNIRRNADIRVLRVRTNYCVIGQIYPIFKNCERHLMGSSGSGASRGQPWGFAGSALGLRGVSLGASRGQPWGFAGSALVFGLSNEAGWRRGPDNRPRSATQAERRECYRPDGVMGFVDTSLISASPSSARVQASDASIAGFGRRNNHEGAISPS